MLLIGQGKVMWVEGEGGAWRLTGNNGREGGGKKTKKRGTRAWKTGDGLQLMQSQSRKTGRTLTSHCDTDKKRRMTWTAHPLQGSASAKWLLLNESPDLPRCHLVVGEE